MFWIGMLNDNWIIDYRNLFSFSFSFLHYRFSKWPREYYIDCSRKRRAAHVLLACWLLSHTLDTLSLAPHRPPTLFTVVNCMSWSGRKLADTVHAIFTCIDITGTFKISSQQLSHATRHYHQKTRETVISHMSFHPCKAVASRPTEIWSSFT